jgi:hypothetical protein
MIIWKRRDMEFELPGRIGLTGEYKLVKWKNGHVVQETPWFDNLILDAGLNRWGTGNIIDRTCIGTGTAAPATSQTSLQSFSASSTNITGITTSVTNSGASLYYNELVRGNRFNVGTLNGTYTEVGVGWGDTTLFSRALIVDGSGNPTSITVLSDEVLDVYYRFRKYPPVTDVTGSRVISGVTYNYILRALSVTNTSTTWTFGTSAVITNSANFDTVARRTYSGDIGLITGTPSGSSDQNGSFVDAAYLNNSLKRETTSTYGLTASNFVGGTRCASVGYTLYAGFQCQFDPVIPKDNTKTLTLNWSVTWGRRP